MKKIVIITFVMLFSMASWGQIVTFEFASITGSEETVVSNSNDENIEISSISRGNGLTASTNADRFNATNWALTSIENAVSGNKYMEFSITPKSGFQFSVSSIYLQLQRSATGPSAIALRSSLDNFNNNIDQVFNIADVTTTQNFTFNVDQPNSNNSIVYRVYMYAEAAGGSGGIGDGAGNDLVIYGTTSIAGTSSILLSTNVGLTESNLNNSVINLTLSNETYVASLQNSYFTLNNAPAGTSIQSVSRVNDTEASITLAFDGTDFDEDVSNFNITASADALTGVDALTSNNLTITAHTAPLATSNAATNTINGNATLNGTVTSKGYATTVTFEYSTDATLTTGVTEQPASQSPLSADAVSSAVSYALSDLSNGQTYYFRVKAVNSEGTTLGSILSFTPVAPPTLFISEVTHPSNAANAKFVELYNYGSESIDLSALSVFLARQSNGGNIASITLTSTIAPHSTFVIAGNEATYKSYFSKDANSYSGTVDGNGNDGYFLYVGGDHQTGTLFDAYGVINEDGTGKPWFYANSKAVRKITVTAPNPTWTASEWVIVASTTERMSPGLFPATVWNGSTNNNWNEASNWDNGTPATTTDVVIWGGATNFPELSTATTVRNFAFTHDAQLNGQENLTVSGSTTMLHQIEFSAKHDSLSRWQYYTSPFTNLTADGMLSSNDRVDLYLLAYDNTISTTINNSWSWLSSTGTAITPGKGFAATAVNDATETGAAISTSYYNMAFTGTLVNAGTSVAVNLQFNEGSEQNNWNLIGNPYLATLDWFDDSNLDYSKIQGSAAYLYNPANGTYRTLTSNGSGSGTIAPSGTQYIPPMQGFFIQALSAGIFEISQAARVNNKQNFYKSESLLPILRLSASVDSLFDETVIIYNEMASNDFDRYDANKLVSTGNSPQLYTTLESGQKLVFNHTHTLESTIGVQLMANTTGRYTLSLNEIGALFNDYNITLTDHTRHKSVTISENDYLFDVNEENSIFDYTLSFQERTSVNTFDLIDLKVFAIKNQLIIQSGYDHTGMIAIYDTTGKKVVDQTVSGYYSTIEIPVRGGLFIVQLNGTNGTSHHKVFINL